MTKEDKPADAEETQLLLGMALSLGHPGEYTPMDRYRDMRQVFLGSDQGKRVLREILAMGHMFQTSFSTDSGTTAFKEGERNMALRVLTAITKEPKERPDRANSKPKQG